MMLLSDTFSHSRGTAHHENLVEIEGKFLFVLIKVFVLALNG